MRQGCGIFSHCLTLTAGRRGMYALGSFDHAPLKAGPLRTPSVHRLTKCVLMRDSHPDQTTEEGMNYLVYRPPKAVTASAEKRSYEKVYRIVDLGAGGR